MDARAIMTTDVVTLLEHMVRRIPIVAGGRVVGIVSASDVMQLFLDLHERPKVAPPSPPPAGRTRADPRPRPSAGGRSRRSQRR
jgi:hypothetical protein